MCSAGSLPPGFVQRYAEQYVKREPPKPHWWQAEFWRLDRLKAEAHRVQREAMVGTLLLLALLATGAYGLADWVGWL